MHGSNPPLGTTMLLERAELLITEGQEAGFDAAMRATGLQLLACVPGVVAVNMGRGVENPGKFMLLVEWQSLDAHTAFRQLPVYGQFRELIGRFSKGGSMEHFRMG